MGHEGQAGDDPQQGDSVAGVGGENGFDRVAHRGVPCVGGVDKQKLSRYFRY
ncbi:hypothetical protein D3C79_1121060 [compost metagenome]